jgi:hypothetical protein
VYSSSWLSGPVAAYLIRLAALRRLEELRERPRRQLPWSHPPGVGPDRSPPLDRFCSATRLGGGAEQARQRSQGHPSAGVVAKPPLRDTQRGCSSRVRGLTVRVGPAASGCPRGPPSGLQPNSRSVSQYPAPVIAERVARPRKLGPLHPLSAQDAARASGQQPPAGPLTNVKSCLDRSGNSTGFPSGDNSRQR